MKTVGVDTAPLEAKYGLPRDRIKFYMRRYGIQAGYTKGRVDAAGNPIEFRLSFPEWMDIWVASGQLANRGMGPDKFVMSRHHDLGHYEVGNVSIKSCKANAQEALSGKPAYWKLKAES